SPSEIYSLSLHDALPILVDLASARYGGEVIWCNDEFFAPASNLISPAAPVWREGEFTDHGKWMDGWETRRRREPGHDSCIIRLRSEEHTSELQSRENLVC